MSAKGGYGMHQIGETSFLYRPSRVKKKEAGTGLKYQPLRFSATG